MLTHPVPPVRRLVELPQAATVHAVAGIAPATAHAVH
jgi:hypothetical protein